MSIGSFFKALLPFSFSASATDVDAIVKQIAAKAEADVAAVRAAAAKAQTKATFDAQVTAIKNKLAQDVASLNSAIKALTAQAAKDIAALKLPAPPVTGAPTGATGPEVTIILNSGPSVQVATPIVVEAAPAGVPVPGASGPSG
jgi:hypothetical protein